MSTQAPRVRKAVIPVAGRGLALLPATRCVPKALLPIVDKPLVEFVVEEAAAAGIEQIIFVTPRQGSSVQDHFIGWRQRGEAEIAFAAVRQAEPRGVGHALCCAESLVDGEPFALLLPDELILDRRGGIAACIDAFQRSGHCSVAVEPITLERTASSGVVATEERDGVAYLTEVVERPGPQRAPSLTGLVGRLVLTDGIFVALRELSSVPGVEMPLTAALQRLLAHEPVCAVPLASRRIDCGTRGGLVQATLEFANRDPDLAPILAQWRDERPASTPAPAASIAERRQAARARSDRFFTRQGHSDT